MDQNGRLDIAVASRDGYLYLLEADALHGKVVWSRWHGDAQGSGNYKRAVEFAYRNLLISYVAIVLKTLKTADGREIPKKTIGWFRKNSFFFNGKIYFKNQLLSGTIAILLPGSVITNLKPLKREGKIFPSGTLFKVFGTKAVYKDVKIDLTKFGNFLKTFAILGKSQNQLVSLKQVGILPAIGLEPFTYLPPGVIVDASYCTLDGTYCRIFYEGLLGFVKMENFTKVEKTKGLFSLIRDAQLKKYPGGEAIETVSSGREGKALYFAPEKDSYLVEVGTVKGWIESKNLKRLEFEDIAPVKFVALGEVKGYISPYVRKIVSLISEGTFLTFKQKVKETNYYVLNTDQGRIYIPANSPMAKVEELKPQRMWLLTEENLLNVPSEGGKILEKLPKYSEVKVLASSGNYVYVQSSKGKGWLKIEALTQDKPDLYPPKVFVEKNGWYITVYIADDKQIAGVYLNGKPLTDLKTVNYLPFKRPFNGYKAEDVKEFTKRVYLDQKLNLTVYDISGKFSQYLLENTFYGFKITKVEGSPPLVENLQITSGGTEKGIPKLGFTFSLSDENHNNLFEGKEKVKLFVEAQNTGTGTAKGTVLKIENGKMLGLPEEIYLGDIPPGGTVKKKFTFTLPPKVGGKHNLVVYLKTERGFMSGQYRIGVIGVDYVPPKFVVDYKIEDSNQNGKLEGGEEGKLTVYIANEGGFAKNVKVKVQLPSYAVLIKGNTERVFKKFNSKEVKKLTLSFVVPQEQALKHKEVQIKVNIETPEVGKKTETFAVALNTYLPTVSLTLKPKETATATRLIASSDVDRLVRNMALPKNFRKDAIAVVIGIENYKNIPTSLYSSQDALLMKQIFEKIYRIKTYALIESGATYAEIEGLLKRLAAQIKDKEVYIFYSGHGFSKGGVPAIVPYDIPEGLPQEFMIDLNHIVEVLKKGQPKKVVLLTDACYSGFDKSGKLIAKVSRPVLVVNNEFGNS